MKIIIYNEKIIIYTLEIWKTMNSKYGENHNLYTRNMENYERENHNLYTRNMENYERENHNLYT